jgi:hypothetical protein
MSSTSSAVVWRAAQAQSASSGWRVMLWATRALSGSRPLRMAAAKVSGWTSSPTARPCEPRAGSPAGGASLATVALVDCFGGGWVLGWFCCDQQKAKPRCGEPLSSRHPESASSARAVARPSLYRSAPREFIRCPVSEIGDFPHGSARAFGGSLSERAGFAVLSKSIFHNTAPLSVDLIHNHIPPSEHATRKLT